MADKAEKTAAVLPLSVEEDKKKKKKQARASLLSWLPAVRDVILWTLLHAGVFPLSLAFGTAYYMLIITMFSHPPSWMQSLTVEMTDAADVSVADALAVGTLWCAAPQAAAGALALMLPSCRRRLRLLLAYAALVATTGGHSMFAGLHRIFFAAEPGGLCFVNTAAIFIVGVVDLLCFLGLILRGGEEYVDEQGRYGKD